MRIQFTLALGGLIAFNVNAKEPLHAYLSSGVEVHETDTMNRVEATGPNIRFFLKNKKILATAFVFKDTRNPYPLLNDFAEQFLKRAYASYDYQIFEKNKVMNNFANRKSDGVEYLVDLGGEKCELYLASSVGNQTYIFFNISIEVTNAKCASIGDKLKSVVTQVNASIAINDI